MTEDTSEKSEELQGKGQGEYNDSLTCMSSTCAKFDLHEPISIQAV